MIGFGRFSNLRAAIDQTRATYARVAQQVYDAFGDGGSGMCHDIAEGVAGEMSGKFDGIEVSEYFGKEVGSRDHVSISLVDHASGRAYELDIPEGKYQRRSGPVFKKVPGVVFRPSDVVVSELDYGDFS